MKKILITGKDSCVGKTIENWLMQWPNEYCVDTLDLLDSTWRKHNFAEYDVIFHVAGIAHVTLDKKMESLFYEVNRDLTIEVANIAKKSGVKQFIFMSSGIVYGDSSNVGESLIIDFGTQPNPANFYGNSKLQAELGLLALNNEDFKVVIIRSPALYGLGMKSHYNNLSDFAKKHHFFIDVSNCRSMLYNKNLAEFVKLMIDNNEEGIFWPQNKEYTSTKKIINDIALFHNKKMFFLPCPNFLLKIGGILFPPIRKAFGSFAYDMKLSEYKENYRVYSYEESINEIESSEESLVVEKKLM